MVKMSLGNKNNEYRYDTFKNGNELKRVLCQEGCK